MPFKNGEVTDCRRAAQIEVFAQWGIADSLNTTVDYIINGDKDEKARSVLNDAELLQQFNAVQQMDDKDKHIIKTMRRFYYEKENSATRFIDQKFKLFVLFI